ncbi:MAG: hypothetical protein A3G18_00460 [Rhodospirillales bacterium RIFCSPLOWO2_12_FULL_58_28]|nr:MAG: hypothetical protein A3H92_03065 [Rhodospirillales bacterium RIFCSPLOWO2_02_FULL_58_16]OHC79934.1 MAG: hypothetical protein A3G18_00460 [Rhodospirillales bacterium RIFCSPLOWO2_12_FULL_58_28]
MRILVIAAALFLLPAPTQADDRIPPVANKIVKRECGGCHMAFQPLLLPQRSWLLLMGNLSDHFGESANLNEGDRREILGYLTGGSADVTLSKAGVKIMRNVKTDETPLRITGLPHWQRKHKGGDYALMMKATKAKSNADCVSCHQDADNGNYDDDHGHDDDDERKKKNN